MNRFILFLITALAGYACKGGGASTIGVVKPSLHEADSLDFSQQVRIKYAKQFALVNKAEYKELYLFVPGTQDTLARYLLYPAGKAKPNDVDTRFVPIAVPIKSIACSSTTQIGALDALGRGELLVATGSMNNITSPRIRKRIEAGKVAEIARGMSRNNELLIAAQPDVFLQDFSDKREQDEELQRAGVQPLLFNAWKETSLLGRAEWLKVLGLLTGRNAQADSLFEHIEVEYQATKSLVAHETDTIQILYGQEYKGVWYVPGEYSYQTKMFADAKIKYDYMPDKVDSTPVSFEHVFSRHRHKKIWLSMMTGKMVTLKDFLALNERYISFDAAREGEIWLDRKRVNEFGGNDYWESGPYNPHLILKDIIKITRPHLLPNYETTYFLRLR